MTKHIYILFLLIVGLLAGSAQSFAQNNKSEMVCCKKESSDSDKSCCKEKKEGKENRNCNNSCFGFSCACPVFCYTFNLMVTFQEDNFFFLDFSNNKHSFFYSEAFISSDLASIWLPPKIS
jgi:hypothetical protein